MRHDEPTRPVRVPRLRSTLAHAPRQVNEPPADDDRERRARLCVDRETERIRKLDPER